MFSRKDAMYHELNLFSALYSSYIDFLLYDNTSLGEIFGNYLRYMNKHHLRPHLMAWKFMDLFGFILSQPDTDHSEILQIQNILCQQNTLTSIGFI